MYHLLSVKLNIQCQLHSNNNQVLKQNATFWFIIISFDYVDSKVSPGDDWSSSHWGSAPRGWGVAPIGKQLCTTLIDCIYMDQAGSGDEFLEHGHKWCMGIVHDVTSRYHVHRTR